jgi:predicted DCC family thiol-disulfide oxidoreductase YuxK
VQASVKLSHPPARPVLIYDGDCTFCCVWICRWRKLTGERVEYLPFQSADVASRFPELKPEELARAVHLVQSDGATFYGAEAGLRALHSEERPSWLWQIYSGSPWIASVAEKSYRFVAEHRPVFSWLTRVFWGNQVEPARYFIVRSLFIRSLALIYLIAFVSLWSQLGGLIGSRGILPSQDTMEAVRGQADKAGMHLDRYRIFPTLCWFDASDRSLTLQCAAGTLLAVFVLLGIAPAPCLFLLWLIYLSLSTICREFLSFQWDTLLLETGFLAIFLSPLRYLPWRATTAPKPSLIIIWLLRWLVFRLMWESGRVKVSSEDSTWADLTALTFHYETQPLPTWIGWYAHQLPVWMQKSSCFLMFRIELVLPFLIFTPRRIRHWVGVIFIAFQAAIFLTGNYCFFNLLTIILCFALFDDHALRAAYHRVVRMVYRASRVLRLSQKAVPTGRDPHSKTLREQPDRPDIRQVLECGQPSAAFPPGSHFRSNPSNLGTASSILAVFMRLAVAFLVLFLTIPQVFEKFGQRSRRLTPRSRNIFVSTEEWFGPFRTFNSYGLFAVMTRPRYEIIVQGSNDGEHWLDYEFNYKPGDPHRRPEFVAPHQPRLDWQMWFAALGTYRENPWFIQFCGRVLQNSPEVLSLLKTNPFPNGPPKYIRAMLYEYHFTDLATRRANGEWWRRELKGEYLPVLSLRVSQRNP